MPKSLEAFRSLLESNFDQAVSEYVIQSDASLDSSSPEGDHMRLEVTFTFAEPNFIRISLPGTGATDKRVISYLPWAQYEVKKMRLDGEGPAWFSTSQLTGCRFTIQYDDASRKSAVVLHIAGGLTGRDNHENRALAGGPTDLKLRRRYSVSNIVRMRPDLTRLSYGGQKAWIFGARGDDGVWDFMAQEIQVQGENLETGLGIKPLTGT